MGTLELDDLTAELEELSSAEEFLDYFAIDYDKRVVQVNRLHILKRFHDYLSSQPLAEGADCRLHYSHWLAQAYSDFVGSSAQEQKVLKVFKRDEPGFVSLDEFDGGTG